jgi:hypothetical protein
LVESKNGSVIRKLFGYAHIPQRWVLRPAVFKVIRPSLFEVSQSRLTRAIIGRTHTEDSAGQNTGFQARLSLHQGFKGSQKSICCCSRNRFSW